MICASSVLRLKVNRLRVARMLTLLAKKTYLRISTEVFRGEARNGEGYAGLKCMKK